MPDVDPWHREARAFQEREWDQLEEDIRVASEAALRPARGSQEGRVRQTISLTMDRELLTELDKRARNRSRFVEAAVRSALNFEDEAARLRAAVRAIASPSGKTVEQAEQIARAALEG